jgi:hypothetical protein
MKQEILERLASFEGRLRELRRAVEATDGERVSRSAVRSEAEALADTWVEELRSPLEHKFGIDPQAIEDMSQLMKRLHVVSRPNNRKSSYVAILKAATSKFKDRFVLPIQQTSYAIESTFDLSKLVAGLSDVDESDYLTEAIACANSGYRRASVVMGWCAAIDRIQRKLQVVGFAAFNAASSKVKAQAAGRYKSWNKEFKIGTLGDLQAVFDRDLIVVIEAMELIDSNQADRLRSNFEYRNQSAHPGQAPIEDPHLVAFFTDVCSIVLLNPTFDL